jgi:crossover junction endodeoxyribonuclease RuvC
VRVLGIDPSSVATGWAVLEGDSRRARVRDFGVLRPPSRRPLAERLVHIHSGLEEVLRDHEPDVAVLESAFLHRNVKTAFALGQVRGVVLLAAVRAGVELAEYSAPEIKRSVVGYGAADKERVVFMVRRILGLPREPTDDEADALATAWCHLNRSTRPVELSEPTGGDR